MSFRAKLKDDGTMAGYLSLRTGDMKWTANGARKSDAPCAPRNCRMPVLATVVVLSLGDRHRRQHGRVLVDPGAASAAAARRRGRRPASTVEPRTKPALSRQRPGSISRSAEQLCVVPRADRVSDGAAVCRASRAGSSGIFGLLVSDNYFDALGVRPAFGPFLSRDEVTRPERSWSR